MAKLNFRFQWYDAEKRVIHLIAEHDWNWRDYHAAARASAFSMMQHPHPVTTLLDFRESTRPTFPLGIAAHAMSFGKKISPALNGQVVVLGLPDTIRTNLQLEDDGTLTTAQGRIYFAVDEANAQAILASLR